MVGEGTFNEQGMALDGLEPDTMQLLEPGEDVKFSPEFITFVPKAA